MEENKNELGFIFESRRESHAQAAKIRRELDEDNSHIKKLQDSRDGNFCVTVAYEGR